MNPTTQPSEGAVRAAYKLLHHPEVTCGVFAHIAEDFARTIDQETGVAELVEATELGAHAIRELLFQVPRGFSPELRAEFELQLAVINSAIAKAKGRG